MVDENEIMTRIARNLKAARQARNLTLDQLAERMGLGGHTSYSKFENGQHKDIGILKLMKLADILGLESFQDLLGEIPVQPSSKESDIQMLVEHMRLLKAQGRLTLADELLRPHAEAIVERSRAPQDVIENKSLAEFILESTQSALDKKP